MKNIVIGVPGVDQQMDLGDNPASHKWFIHNGLFDEASRYLDTDGVWHSYMEGVGRSGGTYFNTEAEAQEIFNLYHQP